MRERSSIRHAYDHATFLHGQDAPLAELQNYSNELKSMTAGAGSYAMDYSHDDIMPPNIQAEAVAAYKPHEED